MFKNRHETSYFSVEAIKLKRQRDGTSGRVVQLTFAFCREHDSKTLWYEIIIIIQKLLNWPVKKMVGFLVVQSKARILFIYVPYFPKEGWVAGGMGGWKKAWCNRFLWEDKMLRRL